MNAQRVLVTGANSALGRSVGLRLRSLGHIPIGTVRKVENSNLESIFDRLFCVNLEEPDSFASLTGSFDSVIHVAALSYGSAERLMNVTGLGTRNLAEKAVELQVRKLIHVSAMSVYGEILTSPVSCLTPIHPGSNYGLAKWAAECYLRSFGGHLESVSVRCPAILGETVSPHFLARLYLQMSRQVPVISLLNPNFGFNNVIHESTLSEFLVLLATRDTGCPTSLPVASADSCPLVEIVDKMIDATSYRGTIHWREGDTSPFSIDISDAVRVGLPKIPTPKVIDEWLSGPITVREALDNYIDANK